MKSTSDSEHPGALLVEWLQRGNEKPEPADTNVTEEVRLFREAITQWATAYAATRRRTPTAENVAGKAVTDLRAWSHNHFRVLGEKAALPISVAPEVETAVALSTQR